MLLNGAVQIEETTMQFPQFALLHLATCAQLRLIAILGNCGCVTVASFLGVPLPLRFTFLMNSSKIFTHKIMKHLLMMYDIKDKQFYYLSTVYFNTCRAISIGEEALL
jgi:hypothetical protein